MSVLRQANGDDYPEAALKHLQDSGVLRRGPLRRCRVSRGLRGRVRAEDADSTRSRSGTLVSRLVGTRPRARQACGSSRFSRRPRLSRRPGVAANFERCRQLDRIDVPDLYLSGLKSRRKGGVISLGTAYCRLLPPTAPATAPDAPSVATHKDTGPTPPTPGPGTHPRPRRRPRRSAPRAHPPPTPPTTGIRRRNRRRRTRPIPTRAPGTGPPRPPATRPRQPRAQRR